MPPIVGGEMPLRLALAEFGLPMPSIDVEIMAQRSSQADGNSAKCWPSNDEDLEALVQVLTMDGPFGFRWPSKDCPNVASPAEETVGVHLVPHDDCGITQDKNRRLPQKSKRLCKAKRARLKELAKRLITMEEVELPQHLQSNKFFMKKLSTRIEAMKKSKEAKVPANSGDARVCTTVMLHSGEENSSTGDVVVLPLPRSM